MEKSRCSCHLEMIVCSTLKRCRRCELENACIGPCTLPFDFWGDREWTCELISLGEIGHTYHRHIEDDGDILTQGIEISFRKYTLNQSTRKSRERTHLIFSEFFPILSLNRSCDPELICLTDRERLRERIRQGLLIRTQRSNSINMWSQCDRS